MRGTQSNSWTVAVFAVLVPFVSACCSTGRASPPDPPKESGVDRDVMSVLSAYEHVPTQAEWARIGTPEEVSGALLRIASKPEGRTLVAARATSSLAFFPRPEVASFLEQRLADAKAPPALRGKAAIALSAGFGDDKARVIAPLFAVADEALREDAIRAFKRLASTSAERFLEERAKVEPSERLRAAMAEARTTIAQTRAERLKTNALPDEVRELPPIADPGPIR